MDLQSVAARAPAPLRVSFIIAGASSVLFLYGAVTMHGAVIRDLIVPATLALVLWSGVLFDWLVSASPRGVQPVTTTAPLQVETRPSRVPPSQARCDRAA
jgi:hypothetical protein